MSQDFPDIAAADKIKDSRSKIIDRDAANRSNFSGANAPSSPVEGQDFYDTDTKRSFRWNGSAWVAIAETPVATIAALKAKPVGFADTIDLIAGATLGDGLGGVFDYDSGSAVTGDDIDVIAPTSGSGRYLRRKDKVWAGTGAAPRPLIRVIRDNVMPSIIDFGGVGDGSTGDATALTNALAQNQGVFLPFLNAAGNEAVWRIESAVTVGDNKTIRGDPRKSAVKQGAAQMLVLSGNRITIENLLIDQSAQSSTAHATFNCNTSAGGVQNLRMQNIVAGISRALVSPTYCGGYRFLDDDNSSGNVIDAIFEDIIIFDPKGSSFYLRDFLAGNIFKSVILDYTRQAAAPTFPGYDINGGAGMHFELCLVQGFGTSGTGNSGGDGWKIASAAAVDFSKCRADGVGGIGFNLSSVAGAKLVGNVAGHNGEGQVKLASCTVIEIDGQYCEGRNGMGWAPSSKTNLLIDSSDRVRVNGLKSLNATRSGVQVANAGSCLVTGFDCYGNGSYGIEETGTSNYNQFLNGFLGSNTTSNGITVGSGTIRGNIILNSGAAIDHTAGAATW